MPAVRWGCAERLRGLTGKLRNGPARRLVVQVAKEFCRWPREVEQLTPDELYEIAAEFQLQKEEWDAKHKK